MRKDHLEADGSGPCAACDSCNEFADKPLTELEAQSRGITPAMRRAAPIFGYVVPDQHFCGCCGNEIAEPTQFCTRCSHHLGPEKIGDVFIHAWDRTYEAMNGQPCPYYLDQP